MLRRSCRRCSGCCRLTRPGARSARCSSSAAPRKEDRELELAFRRIVAGDAKLQRGAANRRRALAIRELRWVPHFVSKKANSSGLQLADLTARPIGLSILRPGQPNRAFDTIQTKINEGMLKCFP